MSSEPVKSENDKAADVKSSELQPSVKTGESTNVDGQVEGGKGQDVDAVQRTSQRTSGLPDDLSSNGLSSNNGSGQLHDLAASFDRMGMSGTTTTTTGASQPSSNAANANASLYGPASAADGRQSLLQRAMNRDGTSPSNLNPSSTSPQHVQHQQSSDANLTPVFNERFLFSDDELEADDSTFVKKYNLNEDDNSFPVLIRHESQPGMVGVCCRGIETTIC
jgi:hypothetical protein